MATPGSKVTGFTPGQVIGGASEQRASETTGQMDSMDLKDKHETPESTISDEYRVDFTFSGQEGLKSHPEIPWEDEEDVIKERKARRELFHRDQKAIEYSKTLMNPLDEGDTLVYISYPGGITFNDFKGLPQPYKIYRVSSENLMDLRSSKFDRMLEDRAQFWARKRKGFLHYLPEGIKYVLDLTPSEEGDEAVEVVSELSCSAGIRNWYKAEFRCDVPSELVCGNDDVPRPAIIPIETAGKFGLDPKPNGQVDFACISSTYDELFTSLGRRKADPDVSKPPVDCYTPSETREKKVLDYCPIRHRFGIENLLTVIQGKLPRLDSAPKVWTLFVLAKYYECTDVVVDYITSWIMTGNNIKFLEILPEASLNIGLGLKIPMITRAAFAILVSEEALNVASRNSGKDTFDKKVIRPREVLDEDLWNIIQHASQDFCDRIQKIVTDLLDERMAWFLQLPEYRKICEFEDYCYKNKDNSMDEEAIYDKRKSTIQSLLINLRGYVRAGILKCLNQKLSWLHISVANRNQCEIQWETSQVATDKPNFSYMYSCLEDREKVLLPYFWRFLRVYNFHDAFYYNLAPRSPKSSRDGKDPADGGSASNTDNYELEKSVGGFNREVKFAVETEDYSFSSNPVLTAPSLGPGSTIMQEDKPNYAFMSAYNLDHTYHQSRLAGIRALERENAEFNGGSVDDGASMHSRATDASTKPLLDIPLHPKKDEAEVESEEVETIHDTEPASSTEAENKGKSLGMKLLESVFENLRHRPSGFLSDKITPTTNPTPNPESTDSLLPKPTGSFPPITNSITTSSHTNEFRLSTFLFQLEKYIWDICTPMLSKPDALESKMVTDTLICLTDNEWQYLPLWAGGNDDGSGGVLGGNVPLPPAYVENAVLEGLTRGVRYKGREGWVDAGRLGGAGSGMRGERNTSLHVGDDSLHVGDGSLDEWTRRGSEGGSGVGGRSNTERIVERNSIGGGDADSASVFSTDSYDMLIMTPLGSESENENEFEIIGNEVVSGDDISVLSRESESVVLVGRGVEKGDDEGSGEEDDDNVEGRDGDSGEEDDDDDDDEDSMAMEWEDSYTDD